MDVNNPVIKLCARGTQAEFEGRHQDAHSQYKKAWELAQNDYEACIAAHYLARFQETPEARLHWNLVALEHAQAVSDKSADEFYPSLYLNLGYSYEQVGNADMAQYFYEEAAALGFPHLPEEVHFT